MEGVVIKSTGSWYHVLVGETEMMCRLKGKFRLAGIKHTNPVTVGDYVIVEPEDGSDNGVITKILERKNHIIRKANNMSKQTHIVAANLDQALLVVTLALPKTSLGFIDRFLVTAEAYHIPAILVFNKCDLFQEELLSWTEETILLYESIGYKCLKTSAVNGNGLNELSNLLKDKTTLISGHSGVGKSTIINAIEPGLNLKTQQISNYSLKGQHTTTFAQMHKLKMGGFIIDTPGIREFGIVEINNSELSHYFKEMKPLIGSCKFNNCIHVNEPDCAVRNALNNNLISPLRYESYLSILNNQDIYD